MSATDKIKAAVWEADRHVETLAEALAEWDRSPATSWEVLEADRARVRIVDQLLFRFIKLQDTVGERLIPATLSILREPFEEWPMRDRLNRLEKMGYLNVENWLDWREVRNRLVTCSMAQKPRPIPKRTLPTRSAFMAKPSSPASRQCRRRVFPT